MSDENDDLSPATRDWLVRFEQAGVLERAALLGGGAVRVTANLIETALGKAAATVVAAETAFRKELDPNVRDAKILDEIDEKPPRRSVD